MLTRRESSILAERDRGLSNKEIAVALGISRHTIKNHISRLLRKLGARSCAEAAWKLRNQVPLAGP